MSKNEDWKIYKAPEASPPYIDSSQFDFSRFVSAAYTRAMEAQEQQLRDLLAEAGEKGCGLYVETAQGVPVRAGAWLSVPKNQVLVHETGEPLPEFKFRMTD